MFSFKSLYRFLSSKYQTLFLEYPVKFEPRYGYGKPPHALLYEYINKGRSDYEETLSGFLDYRDQIWQIKPQAENNTLQPNWNNGFLPGLDIVGIYGMLAKYQPQRYIEVGSGNSTKVAFKAIQEQGLTTAITCIDPQPRTSIRQLANQVIEQAFETIESSWLTDLAPNDILFIDNSHRVLPNSDATVFFLEVLPYLREGVIVHIHDVFLPYDYPPAMCDRFYSEQYLLAAFLLAHPERFKVLLPNYFISEDTALANVISPIWEHPNLKNVERHGGSFWFQINHLAKLKNE